MLSGLVIWRMLEVEFYHIGTRMPRSQKQLAYATEQEDARLLTCCTVISTGMLG